MVSLFLLTLLDCQQDRTHSTICSEGTYLKDPTATVEIVVVVVVVVVDDDDDDDDDGDINLKVVVFISFLDGCTRNDHHPLP